jgi:hypothetical protein
MILSLLITNCKVWASWVCHFLASNTDQKIESNVWTALRSVMLGVYETSISVQDYYGIRDKICIEEDLKNFRTLLKN